MDAVHNYTDICLNIVWVMSKRYQQLNVLMIIYIHHSEDDDEDYDSDEDDDEDYDYDSDDDDELYSD